MYTLQNLYNNVLKSVISISNENVGNMVNTSHLNYSNIHAYSLDFSDDKIVRAIQYLRIVILLLGKWCFIKICHKNAFTFLSNGALKTTGCGVDHSGPGYGTDSLCSGVYYCEHSESLDFIKLCSSLTIWAATSSSRSTLCHGVS